MTLDKQARTVPTCSRREIAITMKKVLTKKREHTMSDSGESMALDSQRSVMHISALPYFTVDPEKRAGMPSLTKCVQEFKKGRNLKYEQ
ncbi:hypothetical protein M1N66_01335 [Thermodesulfovibrionales bacterium]|nr:hypothetical protein [Thermodesulfovibrionales bacterium]